MAEVPKPLPRTRIGVLPLRKLSDSKIESQTSDLNNQLEHPTLIIPQPRDSLIFEIKQKSIQSPEIIQKPDNSKNHINENENAESNTQKETDDEVINEILKYKNPAIQNRILKENESITNEIEDSYKTNEKHDITTVDNTEDLLGIHIHRSDCLKIDRIIRHPSVMVHIVDLENNGTYLKKSIPDKNVTYNQERSSFILPVMTRPYNFKNNKCIIPEWEETLTFNETSSYIIKPSTIFFFEIVDFVDSSYSDDSYVSVGWRHIAWCFLKPFRSNKNLNIEKKLRLQLYNVPKSSNVPSMSSPSVYEWYKKNRLNPYPSTLYVTVKNISSGSVDNKPQQRSCTPFQPEVGSDASVKSLAIFSGDGDDSSEIKPDNSSAIYRLNEIEWSRLPGQSCKIPNLKISALHPDSRGCLAVKFSHSGIFLACGTLSDIFIYAIDGVIERQLTSHQGLIYTLCWSMDDALLLSASADCTCCVWDMKSSSSHPMQVLPHPTFVYCSTFLFPERIIITGAYDGMVRIWYQTHASSKIWQLHQELSGHEGFINALCSYRNKEFFSGDSIGIIRHWAFDECGKWNSINEIKLSEIQGIVINKLMIFPGDKRLLIHTRDSLLRTMDIKSTVAIQWYQGGLNDSFQCNSTITPCGSLIFSVSEDSTVNVWESNTGKQVAFYSSNFIPECGGSVDYHPWDHIAVFSFYSSKCTSSSVYLLKYSTNALTNVDIALYVLNESSYFSYKPDSLSASSVSGEENDSSNLGKLKMKKKRFQPFYF